MYQLIYSIIAIVLVGIMTMHVMLSMTSTQRRQAINEISTQMTEIGTEALERIGRTDFDEQTNEDGRDINDFPLVQNTSQLTAEGSAEWGVCGTNGYDFWDDRCDDVDDFDDLTSTWTREDLDGINYTLEFTVNYVDPDDPKTVLGSQSYAKEVIVEVSNPYFTYGGTPYKVKLSRIYAYERITQIIVVP